MYSLSVDAALQATFSMDMVWSTASIGRDCVGACDSIANAGISNFLEPSCIMYLLRFHHLAPAQAPFPTSTSLSCFRRHLHSSVTYFNEVRRSLLHRAWLVGVEPTTPRLVLTSLDGTLPAFSLARACHPSTLRFSSSPADQSLLSCIIFPSIRWSRYGAPRTEQRTITTTVQHPPMAKTVGSHLAVESEEAMMPTNALDFSHLATMAFSIPTIQL